MKCNIMIVVSSNFWRRFRQRRKRNQSRAGEQITSRALRSWELPILTMPSFRDYIGDSRSQCLWGIGANLFNTSLGSASWSAKHVKSWGQSSLGKLLHRTYHRNKNSWRFQAMMKLMGSPVREAGPLLCRRHLLSPHGSNCTGLACMWLDDTGSTTVYVACVRSLLRGRSNQAKNQFCSTNRLTFTDKLRSPPSHPALFSIALQLGHIWPHVVLHCFASPLGALVGLRNFKMFVTTARLISHMFIMYQ